MTRSPPPVTDAPTPAAALRDALGLLTLQRALAGRYRYRGGAPSPPVPAAGDPPAEATVDSVASDLDPMEPALVDHAAGPADGSARSPYERVEALIPQGSPLREMTSLDEVRDWLQRTVLTPIDEKRINPVLGDGDPHAGLMVIGEAPGADEDREGLPFVGRAGQLLNKILEAIHFRRDEVYISNILKTRPPNNREPQPDEIAAHLPVLYKQITLVRPLVILTVGRTAANSLLGKSSSMGALRGRFHDFHGLPVMVTYHPAALLRNPEWKRPTWEDVKLLRTRYDEMVGAAERT